MKMEEMLIEKVRQHDCLYNIKSTNYRDVNIRQSAWEEIGKELKIQASEAKKAWDKLRRCLCNAKNRRREGTKGGTALKKSSSWKYEQQMAFVIPFLDARKIHGNFNEPQYNISNKSQVLSARCNEKEIESGQEVNYLQSELVDDEGHESGVKSTRDETTCETLNSRINKRKNTPAHKTDQVLEAIDVFRNKRYEEKNTANICEIDLRFLDETDIFFLSMSRMTKRLPKLEQAEIKLNLSNSVLTAEITAQRHHSHQVPSLQQQSLPLHQQKSNYYSSSPSPQASHDGTMNLLLENSSGVDEEKPMLCDLTGD